MSVKSVWDVILKNIVEPADVVVLINFRDVPSTSDKNLEFFLKCNYTRNKFEIFSCFMSYYKTAKVVHGRVLHNYDLKYDFEIF